LRIVEETDDDRPSRPSLRACKVVETTGETVSETSRPARQGPSAARCAEGRRLMSHPCKVKNQLKRAMAVVGVIDSALLAQDLNPVDQSGRVVLLLQGWTEEDWANASGVAQISPLSPETKAMVRGFFQLRAQRDLQPLVLQ
jgi:hypothetical protein